MNLQDVGDTVEMKQVYEETDSYWPIDHRELLGAIHYGLHGISKRIRAEKLSVTAKGTALYGVIDMRHKPYGADYHDALVLRVSTSKQHALCILAAGRVDAGNNLVCHGENVVMKRQSRGHFDLKNEVARALGIYESYARRLEKTIASIRDQALSASTTHRYFYEVFRTKVLGVTRYYDVLDALPHCVNAHSMTLWALYNAFSRAAMALPPTAHYKAMLKLGELFTKWD